MRSRSSVLLLALFASACSGTVLREDDGGTQGEDGSQSSPLCRPDPPSADPFATHGRTCRYEASLEEYFARHEAACQGLRTRACPDQACAPAPLPDGQDPACILGFDEGTIANCEARYAAAATCEDLAGKIACVVEYKIDTTSPACVR